MRTRAEGLVCGARSGLATLSAIAMAASLLVACADEVPGTSDGPRQADAGSVGGGRGDAGTVGDGGGATPSFTIIALPDTQYYAESFPGVFEAQVRWILANRESEHIAFVVHEGDIVNVDQEAEWRVAATALHKLDGVVPYVLAAGNHDYLSYGISDRGTLMNQFFPVSSYASSPGWLGTFENDRVENNAQLLSLNGRDWLVVSLEFGPRDGALAWAAQVLEEHPTTPAIIVTHAYLYMDGSRYDHLTRTDQLWSPYSYWFKEGAPPAGSCNDGQEMWDKLVSSHENVRFVVSGHVFNLDTGEAAAVLSTTRPSGSVVHQIVANYQESGGRATGYLRIMSFDEGAKTLSVSTYSPHLDRWKRDPANEFTLPLP